LGCVAWQLIELGVNTSDAVWMNAKILSRDDCNESRDYQHQPQTTATLNFHAGRLKFHRTSFLVTSSPDTTGILAARILARKLLPWSSSYSTHAQLFTRFNV